MDQRADLRVTLPRTGPTTSYWQDRPDRLADARTTDQLPSEADVVIVGSGITGATVAWNLLKNAPVVGEDGEVSSSPPPPGGAPKVPTVVMLEARQACSGATGRNGGHTKAASYRTYPHHAATLGEAEAVKIAKLELANICAVQGFAAAHNLAVEADVNPCNTVDAIYSAAVMDAARAAVAAMRDGIGSDDPAARYELYSPEEMQRRFYCPGTQGGVGYFAGSLSAYKFTCGVLRMGIARGMNLQTNTPVTTLKRLEDGRWEVETERGKIRAGKVVVATNGYTAAILPKFQSVIVPLRGQITAQRPGRGMPFGGCLPTTYSFIYDGGYEYMITRPAGSRFAGDVIIGGGLTMAEDEGLAEYGLTDDTTVNETIGEYLRATTPRYFGDKWGEDHPDGRVRHEWTGVMGFSPDGYPFVGEVPGEPGLWVSASFQGHGMVLCWKCAEALVEMMEGREGDELRGWFPEAFRLTEERLARRFEGRLKV